MTKIQPTVKQDETQPQALAATQDVRSLSVKETPAYLAEYRDDASTDLLKAYITPPRLKTVQPTSRAPFNEKFAVGDLVILPLMQVLASYDKNKPDTAAFTLTPVMFYPEWVCWNPLDTKGALPGIRDKSFDSRSPIAIKAKNAALRNSELCPEIPEKDGKKQYLKYLEHLNYLFIIHGNEEFRDMAVAMTFASGEHRAGTSFNALITQRRAPLWACNFQAVIRRRTNEKGWWMGVDFENPSAETGVAGWVDAELAPRYKALHEQCKQQYEDRLIVMDYDDEALEGGSNAPPRDATDM